MLETEERLFDEFKRADNICRDMFFCQSGINQYITEMEQNNFYGRSAVPSWDMDYQMLIRVRWLRNQIAHDSSATECSEEDADWIKEFHSRLLAQNDPLALLEKAKQERLRAQNQRVSKPKITTEQSEDRGIPSALMEKAQLSYQTQCESKPTIYSEQKENRDISSHKKKNICWKIVIIVLILLLFIELIAAVAFLFAIG